MICFNYLVAQYFGEGIERPLSTLACIRTKVFGTSYLKCFLSTCKNIPNLMFKLGSFELNSIQIDCTHLKDWICSGNKQKIDLRHAKVFSLS